MIASLQSNDFRQNYVTIKAIFFDAAGTLIKPARRVGESYALFANQYGIEVSPADISERFRTCFDAAPPLAFPGAAAADIEYLERAWWKELVRRVFEPWGRFDRFDDYFAELFSYFARSQAWNLYAEVPEVLASLKDRGLVLDVISNFDSRLIGIFRGLGVAHWFEHIFLSSRVGHAKPAPQIFHAALQRHALKAAEALHVGDSESSDFNGALNAGLPSVLIDRSGENRAQPSPRITSLKSIPSILHDLNRGQKAP
jgi:putative hydrolase of the HAD superfamily